MNNKEVLYIIEKNGLRNKVTIKNTKSVILLIIGAVPLTKCQNILTIANDIEIVCGKAVIIQ